jgi:hypothetical protein
MNQIAMATSILGARQQLTQQNVSIAVMKMAADSQSQVANLLQSMADQTLRTSGSIGTNINTTA